MGRDLGKEGGGNGLRGWVSRVGLVCCSWLESLFLLSLVLLLLLFSLLSNEEHGASGWNSALLV